MTNETEKLDNMNLTEAFDLISHPAHYTAGRKYEPRKVIYDWGLNFNLGNAVKYIARAGRKGSTVEDLKKAIQYIEFELEEICNPEENGDDKLAVLNKENEELRAKLKELESLHRRFY